MLARNRVFNVTKILYRKTPKRAMWVKYQSDETP